MTFNKNVTQKNIGKSKETRIYITKGKKANLENKDVRELYNELLKKSKANKAYDTQIAVWGSNIISDTWNFKGYQEEDLRFQDYDEYLSNKVIDKEKYSKLTSLTIVVKSIPKKIKF
jgi:hypothetical protein